MARVAVGTDLYIYGGFYGESERQYRHGIVFKVAKGFGLNMIATLSRDKNTPDTTVQQQCYVRSR